jgi:hypothetical protein
MSQKPAAALPELATLKQYRHSDAITELAEFADRAHSLTIDSGWRDVADQCLAWLAQQGL